jgi:hypothetical protein
MFLTQNNHDELVGQWSPGGGQNMLKLTQVIPGISLVLRVDFKWGSTPNTFLKRKYTE